MSLGGVNEIAQLYRSASTFEIPPSSDIRDSVKTHLQQHGTVVIGTVLLAVDNESFFATASNPNGRYILGASEQGICAAANTADEKGMMEAIEWAIAEPE